MTALRGRDLGTLSLYCAAGPLLSVVAFFLFAVFANEFHHWHTLHPGWGRTERVLDILDRDLLYALLLPFLTYPVTAITGCLLAAVALARRHKRDDAALGLVVNAGALALFALFFWLISLSNVD